ncbi:MAG: NUDIX domain-containing protein [Candidatus Cyclobacteriaceae bacterium M2_1C_046]
MNQISEKFGRRMRVRVNALIYKENSILLLKHKDLGPAGELWMPPGGGVEFGETTEEALKREVLEETRLKVKKAEFQLIFEFIKPPLHAIEFFFNVPEYSGELILGSDPELGDQQILQRAEFVTFEQLSRMEDDLKHEILKGNISKESLKTLNGTIRLKSNV